MRLKKIKNSDIIVANSEYTINNPLENKGKWNEIFKNKNPIEIEIGTGRGKFIIEKATLNPEINFIGIEKYDSPLVKAIKNLEDKNLNNLKFVVFDATNIEELFHKEINKIYLNFSDPWPKKRHIKRRLTSPEFLKKYEDLFKDSKIIEMKTDNDDLFLYSYEMFLISGYKILEKDENHFAEIRTEYEDKFISLGKNINYIKVEKK